MTQPCAAEPLREVLVARIRRAATSVQHTSRRLVLAFALLAPSVSFGTPIAFDPVIASVSGECSTTPVTADALANVGGGDVPIHRLAVSVSNAQAESGACLLMAISINRTGNLPFAAEEAMGPDVLVDTDAEGIPEIEDGWGVTLDDFTLSSALEVRFHIDQPGVGVTRYQWTWAIVAQPFEISAADVRQLSQAKFRISLALQNTGGAHDPNVPLVSTQLRGDFTPVPEPSPGLLFVTGVFYLCLSGRRPTRSCS